MFGLQVDVHTDALSTSKALLDSELATLDEHVQNLTNRMLSLEEMCVEVHDQGLAAVSEQVCVCIFVYTNSYPRSLCVFPYSTKT